MDAQGEKAGLEGRWWAVLRAILAVAGGYLVAVAMVPLSLSLVVSLSSWPPVMPFNSGFFAEFSLTFSMVFVYALPGFCLLRGILFGFRKTSLVGFVICGAMNGPLSLMLYFGVMVSFWNVSMLIVAALGAVAGGAYWVVERFILRL